MGWPEMRRQSARTFATLVRPILLLAMALALSVSAVASTLVEATLAERVRLLDTAEGASIDGSVIVAREFIAAFYTRREFAPVWTDPRSRGELLTAIDASTTDGLNPADFHRAAVARHARLASEAADGPRSVAARDILLTDALARLLHQLYFGKVDPRSLDPNWNFARPALPDDVVAVIDDSLRRADLTGLIEAARVAHPDYAALRHELARLRAIADAGGWPSLQPGATLRVGVSEPAVAVLRERLLATGELDSVSGVDVTTFDAMLEVAVRRFQARHGLTVDGLVGPATRRALNVPVGQRIDQIRGNLERARWVLRTPFPDVIAVDIARFSVERIVDGRTTWSSRAIVGQPFRQTPLFADTLEYVVFNPTWTVPRSILVSDILPRIRREPTYLVDHGFDVIDGQGRPVSPAVATAAALAGAAFPYILVQRPGPRNALGRIKFMFPNPFAVYLHDTPQRELFDRTARPFSSGCIRVEDTVGLAVQLLAANPGWDRDAISAAINSGETRTVFLRRQLPVLLLYRTADVASDGTVQYREDIYGRDSALVAALDEPVRIRGQPD